MVKGTSRQVIVVHATEEKLFDQAIFLLREGAGPVSDEALLREAKGCLEVPGRGRRKAALSGPLWAAAGASITGLLWILTMVL